MYAAVWARFGFPASQRGRSRSPLGLVSVAIVVQPARFAEARAIATTIYSSVISAVLLITVSN